MDRAAAGDDMLDRPRSSRIYYRGKFFSYPLKASRRCSSSASSNRRAACCRTCKARLSPDPGPANFEDWVTNQFGKRLFNIFFKTYTEKVWGMSCKEISADWAAQRIKGLSLTIGHLERAAAARKRRRTPSRSSRR